ncbi:glycogen/starch synthase, partial [Xanthomonas arboricola]|uniref:glycogen/starch synthase n=1 Tax=Xanthomonas arboricola TaxID=56448 RepID=UPI0021580DFA
SGGTTPCLLTIHNLAYQGLVPYSMAAALGIPAERVAELEFYGQMSFLRGGHRIRHQALVGQVMDGQQAGRGAAG